MLKFKIPFDIPAHNKKPQNRKKILKFNTNQF